MSESLLLIDGMYLIFSSFYANRHMRTLNGEPTGAIFGFVSRIEYLIRELNPDFMVVALDSREKTFRSEMYEGYKAKRLEPPEDLLEQLPKIKEFIKLRGIDMIEAPGFEADDIIALLTRSNYASGRDVYIFSADKDLFQLVGDRVVVFHPKLKKKLGADDIKEMAGVLPGQIVDFLSLSGDASDNIPGVPGIGEKTARRLIEKFGSLDALLRNIEQLDEKIRGKIKANLDLLHLSRKLLDLSHLPEFKRDLSISPFKNEPEPGLAQFYRKLSFNSFLKDIEPDSRRTFPDLKIDYKVIESRAELIGLKSKIIGQKRFSFDIETTGIDFFNSRIVGLSISFADEGYYVPFLFPDNLKFAIGFDFDDFKQEMGEIFSSQEIKKSGHNLKFDILHLRHQGIRVKGVADDSMLMAYLLYPNRRAHNLKELTLELLNVRQMDYETLAGKGKSQISLDKVDIGEISRYCIDDSFLSLRLVETLTKRLEEKHLTSLYRDIEIPLIQVLEAMEFAGVGIDRAFLGQSSERLAKKIEDVERKIYKMAGFSFNINSSQQLGELLFEKMNLPVSKRTRKTKSYSTDIEVLNELKGFPVVEKIIDYRAYKKMYSTYLIGLIESCDENQRVHTSFNQTVTATGRLSSSNPNLQNIPVGELAGINLRRAFVAQGHDRYLISADYSQIELRVMAHFSQDRELIQAFAGDMDVHQHTADMVFSADTGLSVSEKRRRAKIINFSILYGSGAYSLSKELGIGYGEARDFIDRYYEKYAGVKAFIERVIADAEKEPEVQTIAGRKRPIPEILSANRTVKENGKRMAINTIIQGSAADIIKIAMVEIFKKLEGLESRLILQVHDELVFEYPEAEEKVLVRLVRESMEKAVPLTVPLRISLKKAKNWGEMQPIS
jgi:DNA polymerase-1